MMPSPIQGKGTPSSSGGLIVSVAPSVICSSTGWLQAPHLKIRGLSFRTPPEDHCTRIHLQTGFGGRYSGLAPHRFVSTTFAIPARRYCSRKVPIPR
jgi:hypothetical protein